MPACLPSAPPSPSADLAAFAQAVLAPGEPILVAVSGGGDSTALLMLLAPVARAQGRRLVAVIVDHALRDGSADDAHRAAAIARDLGAEARVVRLDWPAGPRTAQAAARVARYAALARVAREVGARTVFLGHTLDDQAETVFMRREAGSGARGLAGMALLSPCPIWPEGRNLTLARPLLGWRRADLRDLLRDAGVEWLEDPANTLTRFARVRARAALARSGDATALAAEAEAAASAAAREDAVVRDRLAGAVFDRDEIRLAADIARAGTVRTLAVLAAAGGGSARALTDVAAARLADRLVAGGGGTLAGAQFRFRAGRLSVRRDPGGLGGRRGGGRPLAPLALPAGAPVVWDRRLELVAAEPGWTATLDPGARTPRLSKDGTMAAPTDVAARWLLRDRVAHLLWRANCSLFTAA